MTQNTTNAHIIYSDDNTSIDITAMLTNSQAENIKSQIDSILTEAIG